MATMTSPPLLAIVLLLLCAFASSSTAAATRAQRGKPTTNKSPPPAPVPLVQSTCNATGYYDICVAVMVADPASSTADLRGLCGIALSAAAANAGATQAALGNTTASSAGAGRVLRECAYQYGLARDALAGARGSVAEGGPYDGNAMFAVNDATDYIEACRARFPRRYPAALGRREFALEQLCAIAMAIIPMLKPTS